MFISIFRDDYINRIINSIFPKLIFSKYWKQLCHRKCMFNSFYDRLTEEENLLKNNKRKLKSWDRKYELLTDQSCSRSNSLTNRKCKINRRKRRATKRRLQYEHIRTTQVPERRQRVKRLIKLLFNKT